MNTISNIANLLGLGVSHSKQCLCGQCQQLQIRQLEQASDEITVSTSFTPRPAPEPVADEDEAEEGEEEDTRTKRQRKRDRNKENKLARKLAKEAKEHEHDEEVPEPETVELVRNGVIHSFGRFFASLGAGAGRKLGALYTSVAHSLSRRNVQEGGAYLWRPLRQHIWRPLRQRIWPRRITHAIQLPLRPLALFGARKIIIVITYVLLIIGCFIRLCVLYPQAWPEGEWSRDLDRVYNFLVFIVRFWSRQFDNMSAFVASPGVRSNDFIVACRVLVQTVWGEMKVWCYGAFVVVKANLEAFNERIDALNDPNYVPGQVLTTAQASAATAA